MPIENKVKTFRFWQWSPFNQKYFFVMTLIWSGLLGNLANSLRLFNSILILSSLILILFGIWMNNFFYKVFSRQEKEFFEGKPQGKLFNFL